MKVEIWSDVMCPFCYIGKRKFETALAQIPQKEQVEVIWKSFQLNPNLKTDPSKSTIQHLAESKGWSLDYTKSVTSHVTQLAENVGLTFNFDKAVVANSFDAHRFSAFAKTKGLQDAAEERLFDAYFTEGKNTADHDTLAQIGADIGLHAAEIKKMLATDAFTEDVKHDMLQAQQFGINGVPYFVFNEKYAVSGAQDSSVFLQVLTKTFDEMAQDTPSVSTGETCAIDGDC
jgi:predicted DsbA family dithiol-disulfide isomerase